MISPQHHVIEAAEDVYSRETRHPCTLKPTGAKNCANKVSVEATQ
jgi:hypothetical protein